MKELKSVLKHLENKGDIKLELSSDFVELREDPKKLEKNAQDAYSSSIKSAEQSIREAINKLESASKQIRDIDKLTHKNMERCAKWQMI